jgi:hypothetical protein
LRSFKLTHYRPARDSGAVRVFPDNPDDAAADGASNLYAWLRIAAETGRPHAMEVQRYDMRDPTGRFVERDWRPRNTPVFDAAGRHHMVTT